MPEKTLPTLDSLLSGDIPVSPSIEIKIGGKLITIAFRVLSRAQVEKLKIGARKYVADLLNRAGLPHSDLESAVVLDTLGNETDLRLLHGSIVDPNSEGGLGPAFSLELLRERILPQEQTALFNQWHTWQTSHEAESLTEDDIDKIIDAARANDFFILLKYGTAGLLSCIIFLANQRETSQTENLSDGAS